MKKFGLLEKLSMLSMNKLIPMLPLLKNAAHAFNQPPMMQDIGYSPIGQLQEPERMQQEGLLSQLLQGGMQGLGSFAGNQLGSSGLDILSGLGQNTYSNDNDLTKLLAFIPEEELRKFLESRQMMK